MGEEEGVNWMVVRSSRNFANVANNTLMQCTSYLTAFFEKCYMAGYKWNADWVTTHRRAYIKLIRAQVRDASWG